MKRLTTSGTLISTFIGASPFFLGFFVKSYLKEKRLSFNLRIYTKYYTLPSVLGIVKDTENPELRILTSIKNNYAKQPRSLTFHIGDDLRLIFLGESDDEAETLLNRTRRMEKQETLWIDEWLKETLKEGPISSKDLLRLAEESGVSRSALFRAKRRIGAVSRLTGFGDGRTSMWELPP